VMKGKRSLSAMRMGMDMGSGGFAMRERAIRGEFPSPCILLASCIIRHKLTIRFQSLVGNERRDLADLLGEAVRML
jgi:hypothetical protein